MVVGNLNSAGVQLPTGKMLTEQDIESTSGSSGKKASLHISPSYSEEKATANVSALNYPFLQPMINLKWLRIRAGLFSFTFLICNGKPDLGIAMSKAY